MVKISVLEEKLSDHSISSFMKKSRNNSNTSEELMWQNYFVLRSYGLSKSKIASRAELLVINLMTIERNYQALRRLGLTDSKIASQAHLLGMNPETIERNYR